MHSFQVYSHPPFSKSCRGCQKGCIHYTGFKQALTTGTVGLGQTSCGWTQLDDWTYYGISMGFQGRNHVI